MNAKLCLVLIFDFAFLFEDVAFLHSFQDCVIGAVID